VKRGGRRADILRHARCVFARRGYHDTSVADIIDEAGIARGTLYLYFDGKRQVFGALLDGLLEQLDDAVRAVRLGPGHPAPLDQVRASVRRVLELLVRDPDNVKLLFHHATGLDKPGQAALRRFYDRLLRMIGMSLEHGMQMGIVRKCDPRVVGACIFGMVKEVVERVALRGAGRVDLEAVAGEIVAFGLKGILQGRA